MFNTLRSIKDVENATSRQLLKHPTRKWDDLDTSLAQAVVDEATGPLKTDLLRNRGEMTCCVHPLVGHSSWKGGTSRFSGNGPSSQIWKLSCQLGIMLCWRRRKRQMAISRIHSRSNNLGHARLSLSLSRILGCVTPRAEVIRQQLEATRVGLVKTPATKAAPGSPQGRGKRPRQRPSREDSVWIFCQSWKMPFRRSVQLHPRAKLSLTRNQNRNRKLLQGLNPKPMSFVKCLRPENADSVTDANSPLLEHRPRFPSGSQLQSLGWLRPQRGSDLEKELNPILVLVI